MYCSMSNFFLAEMKQFKLDSTEQVQFNVLFSGQVLLFQGRTSVVVPYCYLFLLSVFILWFSYYVSDIF